MRPMSSTLQWLSLHRATLLLALVVASATFYVACGGDDREFGSGNTTDKDTGSVSVDSRDDTDDAPTSGI